MFTVLMFNVLMFVIFINSFLSVYLVLDLVLYLKGGVVSITLGLDNVGNGAHLGDGTNRSR